MRLRLAFTFTSDDFVLNKKMFQYFFRDANFFILSNKKWLVLTYSSTSTSTSNVFDPGKKGLNFGEDSNAAFVAISSQNTRRRIFRTCWTWAVAWDTDEHPHPSLVHQKRTSTVPVAGLSRFQIPMVDTDFWVRSGRAFATEFMIHLRTESGHCCIHHLDVCLQEMARWHQWALLRASPS